MLSTVLECCQTDRLNHLKYAHNYYLKYLNNCIRYELISKDGLEYSELKRYFIEDKDSDDVREERFENGLKNVPRDIKIDRMKRILRLKSTEICIDKNNEKDIDEIEEEEEAEETNGQLWINCCVLMTLDRLGLLLREIELLELGNDEENSRKHPQTIKTNENLTRIEKPFKLVKDRKQIAADAFKYGHNLPTMTVDEYLDLEKKRGNIISGGGAASAIKKEINEDDEAVMEIETMKAREFDEFKDSKSVIIIFPFINYFIVYSRGSGNTYNRS